ncbi:MAG: MCE family protein [Saprospiraceae bacterium]|nr:MCE family protein [Saprospiraceae bacterium]
MAKLSNEVKIALLVLSTLLLFFFGYNFLKGQNLFSKERGYHSIIDDASGISTTTKVKVKGVEVGKVTGKELVNNNSQVKITYDVDDNIKIPSNSTISISPGFGGLTSTSLILNLGESADLLAVGSEIKSVQGANLMASVGEAADELEPTIRNLNSTLQTLDSLAGSVNILVSGNNGKNLESSIANLRVTMTNLNKTSKQVNALMETESAKISRILSNAESISANIENNKDALNKIIANLGQASDNFAALDVKSTLDKADLAMNSLNATLETINSGNGSLSLLLNDDALYNSLSSTATDLDRLVLDLKTNPSNYIPDISLIQIGSGKNKEKKQKENN